MPTAGILGKGGSWCILCLFILLYLPELIKELNAKWKNMFLIIFLRLSRNELVFDVLHLAFCMSLSPCSTTQPASFHRPGLSPQLPTPQLAFLRTWVHSHPTSSLKCGRYAWGRLFPCPVARSGTSNWEGRLYYECKFREFWKLRQQAQTGTEANALLPCCQKTFLHNLQHFSSDPWRNTKREMCFPVGNRPVY